MKFLKILIIFISTFSLLETSPRSNKQSLEETKKPEKPWTFILYMAADNDLYYFALKNINQLKNGATPNVSKNVNICILLDPPGKTGNVRHLYIENNKILEFNTNQKTKIDSGNPNSVIDFFRIVKEKFPAKQYLLDFWNHGTGPLVAGAARIINPSELFVYNPEKKLFELDRSIGFFEYIESLPKQDYEEDFRGVCYSDTFKTCLTMKKLEIALKEIQKRFLNEQKISIVAFDACLMAMNSIASLMENSAKYLIASQEVELGTGWPYDKIIKAFTKKNLKKRELADYIVKAYAEKYENITADYTQSAIKLKNYKIFDNNLDTISKLLYESLELQIGHVNKNLIQQSRSKKLCTHFDEPSYIDIHHFYYNLLNNIQYLQFKDSIKGKIITDELKKQLILGKKLIENLVISNQTGKNLKNAKGISIYFPEYYINKTYVNNPLINKNWLNFLGKYLIS
jgi:hypothetical protein